MKLNSKINLLLIGVTLLALVLGCSDSGETRPETVKKSVPPEYIGMWTGQDGSSVTFRNDWSGDYKSGGKSVSGGSFEIDEAAKEIRFSFMGFDAGKYKIDEPPKKNRMRLDGMEYRRTGGFSVKEDEQESSDEEKVEVPPDAELKQLAGETIRLLDDALQRNDFNDFHAGCSEMWKKNITVAELKKSFANTVLQNDRYKLKAGEPLVLKSRPVLRADNRSFDLTGTYPTTIRGRSVPFQLRYLRENGAWKLLGIYLNPNNPPENEK